MEEFEISQSIAIPKDPDGSFRNQINKSELKYLKELTGPNEYLDCLYYLFNDIQKSLAKTNEVKRKLENIKIDPEIRENYIKEVTKKNAKEQIDKFNKIPEYITEAVKNNDFYQANYLYEKGNNFYQEYSERDPRLRFEFEPRDLYYYYIHSVNSMQTPGQSIFYYSSIAQFLENITKQDKLEKYSGSVFPMYKLSLERMLEDPLFTQLKIDTVEEASRQLVVIIDHASTLYPELRPMKDKYINNFIKNVKNSIIVRSILDKIPIIEQNLKKWGDLSSYAIVCYLLNEPQIDFNSPIINQTNILNFLSICENNPEIWQKINEDSPSVRFLKFCSRMKELSVKFPSLKAEFLNKIKKARKAKFDSLSQIASRKLTSERIENEFKDFEPYFKEMKKNALMLKILSRIARYSFLADESEWNSRREIFYSLANKYGIRERSLLPVLRTLDISFKQNTPEDIKKK